MPSLTRVHASGSRQAKLAVVGMAPAREEVRLGTPFVGPSGRIFNETLSIYGQSRHEVFVANICEFPISGASVFDSVDTQTLAVEVQRLARELREVNPNVVLALGSDPLKVLTGKDGILKWRGSVLGSTLIPGLKIVVSVHPAWIIRGMWKWLPVFRHIDFRRCLEESKTSQIVYPTTTTITGPSFNDAIEYIELCKKGDLLSFDIETFWHSEIACCGIGVSDDEAMCIPFIRAGGASYWSLEEEIQVWSALASLLQSPIPKTAQNASFEWLFMWRHHIFPQNLHIDTMTAHHCLYPDWGNVYDAWGIRKGYDEPGHSLAFQTSQYTRTPYYKDDGRNWRPEIGDHALWRYNCMDVIKTHEIAKKQEAELVKDGLWDTYQKYYIRPFPHALRMEWDGTPINVRMREEVKIIREGQADILEKEVEALVGYPLQVRSHVKMKEFLYEKRGYPIHHHRKTKKATSDRETLEFFARTKQDPVLLKIIELQKIRDEISDVLTTPLDEFNYTHCHFKQGGTDGGRWSSTRSIFGSGTNLQNIPRGGVARQLFLPD